ncbi:hypothetical protein TRVL_07631 [Trypanosoma vivax]|nr:hypothetical protein TRVL_07631 [Trypanosoma vivax]
MYWHQPFQQWRSTSSLLSGGCQKMFSKRSTVSLFKNTEDSHIVPNGPAAFPKQCSQPSRCIPMCSRHPRFASHPPGGKISHARQSVQGFAIPLLVAFANDTAVLVHRRFLNGQKCKKVRLRAGDKCATGVLGIEYYLLPLQFA